MTRITQENMAQFIRRAAVLVEALPYIRDFEGKTVVIKYGGAAMTDPALRRSTTEDIVLMHYVGMKPVVVHGGGPEINRRLNQLQVETNFHNGLRVTDKETIDVVEMVLAGSVNKEIVSLLSQAGGTGVGISGKDANLLHARKKETEDGADLGFVGEIVGVHYRIINVLCDAGTIPVIAPLATDPDGNTWNVNADTAAGEIAAALTAEKLIFMTDTPGLLRDPADTASLIHQVDYRDIRDLRQQGIISGGMIPKVEAALKALDYGVVKAHIVDGRVPHALLLELFTDAGLGTLITH